MFDGNTGGEKEVITKMSRQEAKDGLSTWLDLAAHSQRHCEYDDRCSEAYEVLGHDEYAEIHSQWQAGYVHCDDGMYRRR